jgi:methylated-DNA-[protein]-cysteine S-methyltransferase
MNDSQGSTVVMTQPTSQIEGTISRSPVGWMGLVTAQAIPIVIVLAEPSAEKATDRLTGHLKRFFRTAEVRIRWTQQSPVLERILRFLDGGWDDFCDIPVGIPAGSKFAAAVYYHLRRVPPGQTITYQELARRAGFPRAARAVGRAMATNLVPLLIPCHRVVRSDGNLGQYSAGNGPRLKRWLLDLEQRLSRKAPTDGPAPIATSHASKAP